MYTCDGKNDFRIPFQRHMGDELESDQLALAHRQSGTMLVFTLFLILFLLFTTLGGISSSVMLILFVPIPFCILIVRGYYRRDSWALPWVILIWMSAIGLCFILSIFEFFYASAAISYFQGMLLLFLCWSMSQRLRMLKHPMFRAWYDGKSTAFSQSIALQPGEVMASCPHCQSLLAVQPLSLTMNETCPKCMGKLVLPSSIEQYAEEE